MSKGLSNLEHLRILGEHLASDPNKYTIEKKSPLPRFLHSSLLPRQYR